MKMVQEVIERGIGESDRELYLAGNRLIVARFDGTTTLQEGGPLAVRFLEAKRTL